NYARHHDLEDFVVQSAAGAGVEAVPSAPAMHDLVEVGRNAKFKKVPVLAENKKAIVKEFEKTAVVKKHKPEEARKMLEEPKALMADKRMEKFADEVFIE